MKNQNEQKEVKLIDLWYLDNQYAEPVKVKGFKALVQESTWYSEQEGYVFINPKNGAFLTTRNSDTIFESKEKAMYVFNRKIKDHIEFAKKQVKEYTEDLNKHGVFL